MGAGGCREPRRKGARVAAPSGCIVPWAARASCWPQPQQLLPVSAAGSGRRCCCSNPPLRSFCTADKTETPVPGSDTGVLGGRGWIRTTEAESSRFTVCPHWPLGNTPIFTFCVLRRTTCLFYHAERLLSTVFLPFSSNAFSVQRNGRAKAGKALQPCRHGKVGEKSQPEEIDRQIARKTRDNM